MKTRPINLALKKATPQELKPNNSQGFRHDPSKLTMN